jgi:hypothetical protein
MAGFLANVHLFLNLAWMQTIYFHFDLCGYVRVEDTEPLLDQSASQKDTKDKWNKEVE